jgi:hypothetical protein
VLVVDREAEWRDAAGTADSLSRLAATVVGLAPAARGWSVLAQAATGTWEFDATTVVVATGAYVEPREHRAIAGPRPAGVMTGDLARRLLDSGLLPGRAVAMVGGLPDASPLADALARAGAAVTWIAVPDELRGGARLAAVRTADAWLPVDTLILADRLVPQTFLLRGLNLVDARPGLPAPVDADGRLPPDGLWAGGCCAGPDGSHARCVAGGTSVGRTVAAALAGAGSGAGASLR